MDELAERALHIDEDTEIAPELALSAEEQGEEIPPGDEEIQPKARATNRPGELEWMYFQSFGKQALLTREGEAFSENGSHGGIALFGRLRGAALAIVGGFAFGRCKSLHRRPQGCAAVSGYRLQISKKVAGD